MKVRDDLKRESLLVRTATRAFEKGVHRKRQLLSTFFFQSALDFLVLLYQDKSTKKAGPCRRDAIPHLHSILE